MTNPALGMFLFTLGGLAGAIFYMPFKKVKEWAWESYWMIYAIVGLLIIPWILALSTSPNIMSVLKGTPGKEIWYCYLCGAAWGLGGLTWGLMIRYLGVGLGLALGCGLASSAGTLIPKIIKGEFGVLFQSASGIVSFVGVLVSIVGIILVGMAGMSKENEMAEEEKKKAVAEFNFKKGILIAIFSGLMSSAMNFGLQGGLTMEKLAVSTEPLTREAWRGMPVLVVVLMGGFTINFLWCLLLNLKNSTVADYIRPEGSVLLANIVFAAVAGAIWCSQFICLKTGEPAMGKTAYIGFAILMAGQILFSSLLGAALGEWRGTSGKTKALLGLGLLMLVVSFVVAAYSGYISQQQTTTAMAMTGVK
jgi:L-rhamnose-H+ transport protein